MTTAYLRVILSMEILISYAPYRHQRYSSTNSLKRTAVCMVKERVCVPYEFTLLSNSRGCLRTHCTVCFPYEFTLLSNPVGWISARSWVCFPYEFTLLSNDAALEVNSIRVCFPYEFTLLSNYSIGSKPFYWFVSPTNLHCSQTVSINWFKWW